MAMNQNRGRRIRGVISLGTGVAVVVALGASLIYFLWVASIRSADQIGQLSIGTLVVGIACAFAALMLAFSMIRAIRRAEDGRALLAFFPETGRTHQIRVHMASIGHPLIGDATYGSNRRRSMKGVPKDIAQMQIHREIRNMSMVHA